MEFLIHKFGKAPRDRDVSVHPKFTNTLSHGISHHTSTHHGTARDNCVLAERRVLLNLAEVVCCSLRYKLPHKHVLFFSDRYNICVC